jgi:hypothetical protein
VVPQASPGSELGALIALDKALDRPALQRTRRFHSTPSVGATKLRKLWAHLSLP